MTCIPEETALLYVERELAAGEVAVIVSHLGECAACRDSVGRLREENAALVSILEEPSSRRMRVVAQMAGSIAASLAVAFPAQWALSRIGEAGMWANHVAAVPFELVFRAVRAFAPLALLLVLMQMDAPGMTRRTGQGSLVIGSQEVIRDTVFATGDTVLVEGKIEGTLFMFGRSLEIRGEVDGDVITGGQDVRILGTVNGNVLAAGETITVRGLVTGSVYAGGRNVRIESGGQVQRDVFSGSETVIVDGTVGRELTVGAATAMIAGSIGRGITFGGDKVLVRSTGQVGGDIRATVPSRDSVLVEPGAAVGGQTDVSLREPPQTRSGVGRWAWEFAVLAGAFVVGWILLTMFPTFFGGAVQNVLSWASAGWGFVALVVTPVAVLVLCITLLGIPLGIALLMIYLVGLYLAKIVVGGYVGRELLGSKDGLPTMAGVMVGIALVQAVFFLPYGGWLLHVGVFCLGLGALVMQLMRARNAGTIR